MSKENLNFKVERLYRFDGDGPMKAFADIVINEALLIKGIRVIEGKKGLFVSMPKMQGKDKKWYDTIRPLNNEAKNEISEVVLSAYNAV
jgi:stage V sporulation protein G